MNSYFRIGQKWISIGLLLLVLMSACQAAPAPQVAPSAGPGGTPSAQASPQNAPTEPSGASQPGYSQRLGSTLAKCTQMARNQVCYGSGQVEAASSSGSPAASFTRSGDTIDLSGVSTLAVHPGSSAPEDWGVALLKLQADFEKPDQALTVAALGKVNLTRILTALPAMATSTPAATATIAASSTGDEPVEPLQEIDFHGEEDPSADKDTPNGLLIWTPPGDDLASIKINGAEITLGSMALIESANGLMTVSMVEGSAIVQVGVDSGFVTASNQISVPLDSAGMANGAPSASAIMDPRAKAISDAVSQYAPDPRAEAISNAIDQYPAAVVRDITRRFNRAINRCTDLHAPDPHYVYNTLYYYNRMVSVAKSPDFEAAMSPNLLADMALKARRCLSFELDFDFDHQGQLG